MAHLACSSNLRVRAGHFFEFSEGKAVADLRLRQCRRVDVKAWLGAVFSDEAIQLVDQSPAHRNRGGGRCRWTSVRFSRFRFCSVTSPASHNREQNKTCLKKGFVSIYQNRRTCHPHYPLKKVIFALATEILTGKCPRFGRRMGNTHPLTHHIFPGPTPQT